jgi:hypothetical protein
MALSTAHGASTLFAAEWNELQYQALMRQYTTGTGTTMFADLSTYAQTLATTSACQPLFQIKIPPWVLPSRIDFSMGCAACSSNTANSYCVLVLDSCPRVAMGQMDFITTATLSTSKAGVITGYFPTTSSWATFTTQFRIVGGQTITIAGLSTTAPVMKIKDIKIQGTPTTQTMLVSDTWTTNCGSTLA